MKKEQLYYRTVDILVNAYFNDTLRHGNCSACAVGNIIAANQHNYYIVTRPGLKWATGVPNWRFVFSTIENKQYLWFWAYAGKAKEEIDSTGYTVKDLAKIEYAFETGPKGNSDDEWMFNGLMAVIEVLDQIHENTDVNITSVQKNRFNKYKLGVDSSELSNDTISCQCYTLGMPHAIDPGVEKSVTIDEIRQKEGDYIWISTGEDGYEQSFNDWFAELPTEDLHDICADIINKRENRTVVYVHSEPYKIQDITAFDEMFEKIRA